MISSSVNLQDLLPSSRYSGKISNAVIEAFACALRDAVAPNEDPRDHGSLGTGKSTERFGPLSGALHR